ncbi:hypothetical protein TYRP_007031 [Tyrophagus putrescentiae]|nr:hypothetical protein TYRP_007031 [Tyrophagus putrescentiae]
MAVMILMAVVQSRPSRASQWKKKLDKDEGTKEKKEKEVAADAVYFFCGGGGGGGGRQKPDRVVSLTRLDHHVDAIRGRS